MLSGSLRGIGALARDRRISPQSGSARGEILSRQLPARRSLRCDLDDIDRTNLVGDCRFATGSLVGGSARRLRHGLTMSRGVRFSKPPYTGLPKAWRSPVRVPPTPGLPAASPPEVAIGAPPVSSSLPPRRSRRPPSVQSPFAQLGCHLHLETWSVSWKSITPPSLLLAHARSRRVFSFQSLRSVTCRRTSRQFALARASISGDAFRVDPVGTYNSRIAASSQQRRRRTPRFSLRQVFVDASVASSFAYSVRPTTNRSVYVASASRWNTFFKREPRCWRWLMLTHCKAQANIEASVMSELPHLGR